MFALAAVAIVGIVQWVLPPYRYKRVKPTGLKTYLEALLWRGFDNGYIMIVVEEKTEVDRFLQFAKYIDSNGTAGLELVFPLVDWSKQYYAAFKELLDDREIAFLSGHRSTDEVSEVIIVDTKQDLGLAYNLCVMILSEVFGIPDEVCAVGVTLHNIDPRNVRHGR